MLHKKPVAKIHKPKKLPRKNKGLGMNFTAKRTKSDWTKIVIWVQCVFVSKTHKNPFYCTLTLMQAI